MADTGATINAGSVPSYLARPEGDGRFPALLVFFEAFGLNDHIRRICERLAGEGYVAIAPDFYHRQPPPRVTAYADRENTLKLAERLTDDDAMSDVGAAIDYLKAKPFVQAAQIGAVGFCLGGRLAFLSACRFPDIRTAVSFYGGRIGSEGRFAGQTAIPLNEAEAISGPLLLFFGGRDANIPLEEVKRIEARLQELNKEAEVIVYPEAGHGFFCDERDSYNAEAARDAWGRTQRFLRQRPMSKSSD
jgi:carboxymethylenebutenolidase